MIMNGLPHDFNTDVFVARLLEQVCYTENQVTLHFDGDVHIVLEGGFAHGDVESESIHQVLQVPVHESHLMRLLGASITEASASRDGTLRLVFSNGDVLNILNDTDEYESYQIQIGDKIVVV
jgi:hypothetical protein